MCHEFLGYCSIFADRMFKWRKIFSKNSDQIEYVSLLNELKIWLILEFAGSSAFTISNLRSLSWMMRCSWAKSENLALKNCSSLRLSYVGLWHFHLCGKRKKVGFTEEQPELQIDLFRTLLENKLATKQDSANVQIDIAGLRKETEIISSTSAMKPNWVNHRAFQI